MSVAKISVTPSTVEKLPTRRPCWLLRRIDRGDETEAELLRDHRACHLQGRKSPARAVSPSTAPMMISWTSIRRLPRAERR